jgi:Na+-transporting methylmalonyl-CoA/oxaloacetate decarboxylase beta subunit
MCKDGKIVGVSERPIYTATAFLCHKSETRQAKRTKARRVSVQERLRYPLVLWSLTTSSKSQTVISGIVTGNILLFRELDITNLRLCATITLCY